LHVSNLARRSSLEAGRMREKRGGEERRNARNSVWQFGTGKGNSGGARACIRYGGRTFFFNAHASALAKRSLLVYSSA